MTPELSRANVLRILEAELRSALRGCCRLSPVALASQPGILEHLDALAAGIGSEARELEERHA